MSDLSCTVHMHSISVVPPVRRIRRFIEKTGSFYVGAFLKSINGDRISGEFLRPVFMSRATPGKNFCHGYVGLCM